MILGLSWAEAVAAALIGAGVCLAILGAFRPLLFASVDDAVAAAAGVPVRALGVGFLAVVGMCAAETTIAVGALLLLGLLAAPAAAAHRLTTRPGRGIAVSAALAVLAMWSGLAFSYVVPAAPPSFSIVGTATLAYVVAAVRGRDRRTRQMRAERPIEVRPAAP